ncbi:MAG: 50S ribosomal protein L23 [Alphaproteobacteria bacterium]|nr:50S ribosomal protein L23 [Alphaproteobacteria bacterium]MCK5518789.1 50S ribosomal protein L23 [Alphaproteobacteria bacterium]MCK5556669.1 50S ribosomal protein L23 [Alphaproteobacteria bacterium]MCK5659158.1 50S ribosomal protein L23 [Alphaproteobacteria bacterium]
MINVFSKKKDAVIPEILYQMIRCPVVTEKATLGSQHSQVTFRVPLDAGKAIIKEAVQSVFKVKVINVNTSRQKGKLKVFKGRRGSRNDTKKAIVTLAEGQMIDVATGV